MKRAIAINDEFDRLLREIPNDFFGNIDSFVTFISNNTSDRAVIRRAILLANEYRDVFESGNDNSYEAQDLLIEAVNILNRVADQEVNELPDRNVLYSHIATQYKDRFDDNPVLAAENIQKRLGHFEVNPVSFILRRGEITSIVGKNGNGKSTVLKMAAGALAPDSGEICYPGFSKTVNWLLIKQKIGYISQDLPDWSGISSRTEHLHFTAAVKGIKGQKNKDAVEYILTRLGLKKYQQHSWNALSGGYKLRFELARQLVWSPQLLIMDEPLAHLDIKTQKMFLDDLRNLTDSLQSPMAVMLSSQNLYEIEGISDNIIFMENGVAKYNGPVQDIKKITNTHSFLIKINASAQELKSALESLEGEIVKVVGDRQELIITATQEVTSTKLIKTILAANIAIEYFRDVSNSTRVFFESD